MKKIITTVIILLLILALPAITGQYLKHTVMNRINHNRLPNGQQVQVADYHVGWLHSVAEINITQNPAQISLGSGKQNVNIHLDIAHGPLAISKDNEGHLQWILGLGLVRGTVTMFGNLTMNLMAKVSFLNNIDLQISSHNAQSTWNKFQINVGDVKSHILIAKRFTVLSGDTNIQNFQIVNPAIKMQLQMSKLDSVFSLEKDASGLWLGKRATIIPDFAMTEAGVQLFALQSMNFNMDSQAKDGQVNASVQMSLNKVLPIHYDPLGPINIEYHLSGIALDKLNAFSQFVTSTDLSAKNPNAEQMRNQMMLYLVDALQGSTQSLDNLSVGTPKGSVTLAGKIILPKQALDVHQAISKPMLALLISQLSMRSNTSFKLVVPADLLADVYSKFGKQSQTLSYVKILQDSGFIVLVNNNYVTDFTYNQGQAMVNKQPIAEVIQRFQLGMQNLGKEQPAGEQGTVPAAGSTTMQGATPGTPSTVPTQTNVVPQTTPTGTPVVTPTQQQQKQKDMKPAPVEQLKVAPQT